MRRLFILTSIAFNKSYINFHAWGWWNGVNDNKSESVFFRLNEDLFIEFKTIILILLKAKDVVWTMVGILTTPGRYIFIIKICYSEPQSVKFLAEKIIWIKVTNWFNKTWDAVTERIQRKVHRVSKKKKTWKSKL